MPGDAGQDRGAGRRGEDDAVLHDEDVLAGPFRDVAVVVQRDALVEAVLHGLHLHQLGIQVVPARLGEGREGVGRGPLPGGDAHRDALGERFLAQVGAPGPGRDGALQGVLQGIDPHRSVAPEHEGADVAGLELVHLHHLHDGLGELLLGEGDLHAVDLGRIEQPVDVGVQPEDGGALPGVVGAQALEHAGSVMHHVGQDVDVGLLPIHHFAVEPDFSFAEQGASPVEAWMTGRTRFFKYQPKRGWNG